MSKIADVLTQILGLFSVNFEGFLIAGLFHAEVDKTCMRDFGNFYSMKNLKKPTCFKNP